MWSSSLRPPRPSTCLLSLPHPRLTNCGGGVYAGADTSCSFALNVAADYTGTGPDYAYSPVTGLSYTMNCYDSNPIICTGGNNALVQIGS